MNQEHDFWVQMFLKATRLQMATPAWIISTQKLSKPLRDIGWECPSISLPPKPGWEVLQSFFSHFTGWHASILHPQTASTWRWWKAEVDSYFCSLCNPSELIPNTLYSWGRREEHSFANSMTLLNSAAKALWNINLVSESVIMTTLALDLTIGFLIAYNDLLLRSDCSVIIKYQMCLLERFLTQSVRPGHLPCDGDSCSSVNLRL